MKTISCHSNQSSYPNGTKKKQYYSFPLPIGSVREIWRESASWLQRRCRLKMLTDGRTDDDGRRVPGYTISPPMSLQLRWAKKTAKSHFAWFCSLLQMCWAADKAQRFIPTDSWSLRRRHVYFCHVFWCEKLKNDKVNRSGNETKLTARLNPNHMHIFKPWKKDVQSCIRIGIKLYEELRLQGTHCLYTLIQSEIQTEVRKWQSSRRGKSNTN